MMLHRTVRKGSVVALLGAVLVSACSDAGSSGEESGQGTIPADEVLRHIKYDIGSYIARDPNFLAEYRCAYSDPAQPTEECAALFAADEPDDSEAVCGTRPTMIPMRVVVTMNGIMQGTEGGGVGLSIPLGELGSASAGANASQQDRQSFTTAFTMHLDPEQEPLLETIEPSAQFYGTPIADAIDALADAMGSVADERPCFKLGGSEIDEETNRVVFGFEVVRSDTEQGNVQLAIFSASGNASSSQTASHQIEVTFRPVGLSN